MLTLLKRLKVVLFFFCCFNVSAQDFHLDSSSIYISQYSIQNFTSQNGLPQNEIVDLFLGSNNLLWISTRSAIIRYEGRELEIMDIDFGNKTKFISWPFFYRLNEDSIVSFINENRAVRISSKQVDLEPIADSLNLHIGWRGSFRSFEKEEFFAYRFRPIDSAKYYFANELETRFYDGNTKLKLNSVNASEILYFNLFEIDGRFFNITSSGHVLEINNNQVDTLFQSDFLKKSPNQPFQLISHYGEKDVFLYRKDELYRVSLEDNQLHLGLILKGLPSFSIQAIEYSEELGQIFIGTRKNGLIKISKSSINQIEISLPCKTSIDNYAIAQIGKDSIINSSGVLFNNGLANCDLLFKEPLNSKSLFYDAETELLYSSGQGGITVADKKGQRIKKISVDSISMGSKNIIKYKGEIYFTLANHGLCKVVEDEVKVLVKIPEMINMHCHHLRAFSDSVFYMAGIFGVLKVNPQSGEYEKMDFPSNSGAVYIDIFDSVIWIGTYGEGIYFYKTGHWYHFAPKKLASLNYAHNIIRQGERVYIPTNNGFFGFRINDVYEYCYGNINKIQAYVFDNDDGLRFNEFNGRCQNLSLEIETGEVVFPTLKGLVYFDVKSFTPPPIENKIFLEEVIIQGEGTQDSAHLSLASNYQSFELKLLHPYYGKPLNAETFYRIPEISSSWSKFDPSQSIRVDRLPFGNYSIDILIPGSDDGLFKPIQVLTFKVDKPYYFKVYFLLSISISIILLVVSGFLLYRQWSKRKRRELEVLIQKRTEQLRSSNKEIEKALRIREKIITVFSHDIRGPLSYFKKIVKEVQYKAQINNYKNLEKELYFLMLSAESSFTTADNVVNWIHGQISIQHGQIERVNLEEVVLGLLLNKREEFSRSKINGSFDIHPDCFVFIEIGGMEIILNNIIQNSLKYSRTLLQINGRISENSLVILEIFDDGGGIDNQKKLDLLNLGNPVKSNHGRNGQIGSGLGLFMIREIVMRNKGTVHYSNFEKGLMVQITFPLAKEDGEEPLNWDKSRNYFSDKD